MHGLGHDDMLGEKTSLCYITIFCATGMLKNFKNEIRDRLYLEQFGSKISN
jgi:hypothetical protein